MQLAVLLTLLAFGSMAQSSGKKLIQIDASIDTVCPWCFMGKKNLDKALNASRDEYDFQVRWHSFFLDPSAPKIGAQKTEYYQKRFGAAQWQFMASRMSQIFQGVGVEFDTTGLTGSTLDSHRLLNFAGRQGFDKQTVLVEELMTNFSVRGKFIGDRQMLVEAAEKAGIQGAKELLEDPKNGLKELYEDIEMHSAHLSGVPNFVINGEWEVHRAQPPEAFLKAFRAAAK